VKYEPENQTRREPSRDDGKDLNPGELILANRCLVLLSVVSGSEASIE